MTNETLKSYIDEVLNSIEKYENSSVVSYRRKPDETLGLMAQYELAMFVKDHLAIAERDERDDKLITKDYLILTLEGHSKPHAHGMTGWYFPKVPGWFSFIDDSHPCIHYYVGESLVTTLFTTGKLRQFIELLTIQN